MKANISEVFQYLLEHSESIYYIVQIVIAVVNSIRSRKEKKS